MAPSSSETASPKRGKGKECRPFLLLLPCFSVDIPVDNVFLMSISRSSDNTSTVIMAGSADAAKNFLESAFNKTKEVVSTAGESAKGFANVAIENVQKIIPGQQPAAQPEAAAEAAPAPEAAASQ
uniref:Small nuclear ribonucleoprotein n=2 Tax=Bursaphelenchus xylophilus TaxID=6326 RepID=A0A1I7RSH3_BURXY